MSGNFPGKSFWLLHLRLSATEVKRLADQSAVGAVNRPLLLLANKYFMHPLPQQCLTAALAGSIIGSVRCAVGNVLKCKWQAGVAQQGRAARQFKIQNFSLADVAQLVEHSFRKWQVKGSSPFTGSSFFFQYYFFPTLGLVCFSPMPFGMAIHTEHIFCSRPLGLACHKKHLRW